jgi:CheY-like chemotaxis protein
MHSSRSQASDRVAANHNGNGNGNGNGKGHKQPEDSRHKNSRPSIKTILFVDDEPSILEVRSILFEALGYGVLTAASGEEALVQMQARTVDAVVLDYLMPVMDGEETARKMRQVHGAIPILLSSGCLALPKSVMALVDASVDKGRGPLALIKAIEQLLQGQPVPDDASMPTSANAMAD